MPINSSTVFDNIRISCDCSAGALQGATVRQGTTSVANVPNVHRSGDGNWDPDNAEVAEVISRIVAGTCAVYMWDPQVPAPNNIWLEEDTPIAFSRLRNQHPFHATRGYLTHNVFLEEGDITLDATTGRQGIALAADIIPQKHKPDGTTYAHDLSAWNVVSIGPYHMRLFIDIPESDQVANEAALDEYPPVEAMLVYLESVRITGNPIADLGALDTALTQNRIFAIPQSPSPTLSLFVYETGIGLSAAPNEYVTSVYINLRETPDTESIVIDNVVNTIATVTANIPITDRELEAPVFGNTLIPVHVSRLLLPGDREIDFINDTILYKGKDSGGRRYTVPLESGYGRTKSYAELPDAGGFKMVPVQSFVDAIHYENTETADGIIRFPVPRDWVRFNNVHRMVSLHNLHATRTLTIQDFVGTQQFILRPGEFAKFQVTFRHGGVSTLLSIILPPRFHTINFGRVGNLAGSPHWAFGSDRWIRPIPLGEAAERLDLDAFEVGTTVTTPGSNFPGANNFHVPESERLRLGGELTYKQNVDIQTSETGNVFNLVKRLYRWDDNGVREQLDTNNYGTFSSNTTNITLTASFNGRVEAGDTFLPTMLYDRVSSLNVGDVDIFGLRRNVILKPEIRVEHQG